jgi:hypothetical protein
LGQNYYSTKLEAFLMDEVEMQRLIRIHEDNTYIVRNHETSEILWKILPEKLRDRRFSVAKRKLRNDNGFYNRLFRNLGSDNIFHYTMTFKHVDMKYGRLENLYDGRKYQAIKALLERNISGSYIATLAYGVAGAGLHAHVICGENQSSNFLYKGEKVYDIPGLVSYISKPIVEPINEDYSLEELNELQDIRKALSGKIIEYSRMKKRMNRTTIFATSRKVCTTNIKGETTMDKRYETEENLKTGITKIKETSENGYHRTIKTYEKDTKTGRVTLVKTDKKEI